MRPEYSKTTRWPHAVQLWTAWGCSTAIYTTLIGAGVVHIHSSSVPIGDSMHSKSEKNVNTLGIWKVLSPVWFPIVFKLWSPVELSLSVSSWSTPLHSTLQLTVTIDNWFITIRKVTEVGGYPAAPYIFGGRQCRFLSAFFWPYWNVSVLLLIDTYTVVSTSRAGVSRSGTNNHNK